MTKQAATTESQAAPRSAASDARSEHKKKIIIIGTLAVAALAAGVYWFLTRGEIDTDDAYTHGRVVAIAPHVNGFVSAMYVDDNRFIHKGDLLVQLDGRDYLADLHKAEAAVQKGLADVEAFGYAAQVAEQNYPGALAAAKGAILAAQGALFKARRDYERQLKVKRAATSQRDIDASKASLTEAEGEVARAQGELRQAMPVQASIGQAKSQVSQASAELAQAKADLEKARLDFGWTQIRAPQDGWISQRNIERGMFVQAGQDMFSIVPKEVWVVANYKETQITDMRRGQPVTIHVDAYPGMKLKGHVDSIQMGTGESFSTFPPENATGNFVKTVQRVPVKIVIDSGLDPERPLALGLSVEPVVHTLHHMHPDFPSPPVLAPAPDTAPLSDDGVMPAAKDADFSDASPGGADYAGHGN